ncbi:MAG TPA: amino acid permease [Vicinamibacterales bacterium]|nr:amino acid permease [Vicinamibacterales bacterium]
MSLSPLDSGLQRKLGPLDAAAIVISNVIGGGIFFVPVIVAQLVPHPAAMLSVWIAGGALSFAGAMAYAELAAVRPHAGGEYVYLRDGYGPLAAFLTGWTSFIAGFSGAIAASAAALAGYVGRFVPIGPAGRSIVALSAIAALTLVHVRGLGPGRLVQNVLAVLKVSGIVLLVAAGCAIGGGHAANFSSGGRAAAASWFLALVPVMFSYSGWNAAAYVAEEVRDPGRNVPLALAIGTVAVIVLYVALNALYIFALPVDRLAALPAGRLMDTVAEQLFGHAVGDLLAVFTIVSITASISAMILAGPRVYFAMARDGIFVRAAARVHPRFRTPAASIVAQGIWSGVLVLSGTLSQLVTYTGFAVVLFAGIAVSAVFVLRRRDLAEAAEPRRRAFSALGYPWAPAVFVVASAMMVANELWRNPRPTLAGLALIAAGVPVYYAIRRAPPA